MSDNSEVSQLQLSVYNLGPTFLDLFFCRGEAPPYRIWWRERKLWNYKNIFFPSVLNWNSTLYSLSLICRIKSKVSFRIDRNTLWQQGEGRKGNFERLANRLYLVVSNNRSSVFHGICYKSLYVHSSFPVIHKVGNIGIFVQLLM